MSIRTIDSYTYHVDRFAKHFGKQPEDLGPDEIREFQLWMIQVNKSSWSQFNQAVCGLRFLYSITLSRPWVVQSVPYGKRPKSLPTVLGQEEVNRLIGCVDHLKRAIWGHSFFVRAPTQAGRTQPTKVAGALRRAVRSSRFAEILSGRHMECAYYFDFCRLCPSASYDECLVPQKSEKLVRRYEGRVTRPFRSGIDRRHQLH